MNNIIINSILIIFILHIIILNINYHVVIGKKTNYEKFTEKNSDVKDNSIDFLTNNNNNDNNDFKQKILKYMQQNEIDKDIESENKNLNKVSASNTYLTDNNEPNFESNVADISKFYKFNYDNLNEDQLKSTSIEKLNKDNISIDTKTKEPCNIKNYGRESTVTPDNWIYKNELPMNGGNMNGIIGFDSLESQFAIYNPNKLNLQTSIENKFNNIPHDDLRKPIIYEN